MMNHYNKNIFSYASAMIWLILLSMLLPTLYIVMSNKTILLEWYLMSIAQTPISFTMLIDPLGMMFSLTVLFISANVLSFSTIYMGHDKYPNRFTILVLMFILSMNLLIFLPHFMILLLGWDGLGIVSFILVIYYQNSKSLAAGMITALTNRIGDVMLLLSIAWTINQGHWLIINMWESNMMLWQIFTIMVAAMTKSAQMPFSSWLPAAMAAPTPVSALVHSSTLVTAGVFLMIRFYPFLHSVALFNTIILFIAVSTMLMAGLSATTECDMKKIIALSTLSQLGMMMTSIGLNAPNLAYFHMITHALFKALLFICAGSYINQHHHTQDLRWMGNLTNQMPAASSCITIANLALCGFPFMAGFYSKDLIMESALNMNNNAVMVCLAMMSLGLTSFYSIRFSLVVMWAPNSCSPFISIYEYKAIIIPITLLSVMSVTAGSAMSWMSLITSNTLFILPTFMKVMPLMMISMGLIMGWMLSTNLSNMKAYASNIIMTHYASCLMWFLVPISSQFMLKSPLITAHHYLKSMDQGWLEVMTGQGFFNLSKSYSNSIMLLSPKHSTLYLSSSTLIMTAMILTYYIFNH